MIPSAALTRAWLWIAVRTMRKWLWMSWGVPLFGFFASATAAVLTAGAPASGYAMYPDVQTFIAELVATRQSERQLRIIDHDQDGSMEIKKREGYF